ncbi:acetyl-coenzyme A synthetase, partial [Candidatus Pelagibacter sp.]|nr:acetyl-coenzyme A synthetase [Candidatus Pelagibacter sp.]
MPKKKKKTKTKVKKKIIKVSKKNKSSNSAELVIKTKPEWIKSSLANKSTYQKKYNDSIKNNDGFWKKEGKRISWIKP